MAEIAQDLLDLLGEMDFDAQDIRRRYAAERDIRLRPDGNSQYIATEAQFSHYADDPYAEPFTRASIHDHVTVAIVGGGYGGVLGGLHLSRAGIKDVRIIEKGGDFGGVWYWNRYPGLRCDTESYVYMAESESIGLVASEKYARGAEIRESIHQIARKAGLYDKACLQTEVTGMQWDEQQRLWRVQTDRGDDFTAQFVMLANGLLAKPKLPGIPGMEQYRGHTFHTSRWDYDYTGGGPTDALNGLRNKKVGVVGTAATGIQLIPHVAKSAEHLYVFQRTPAAVDVRANAPTDDAWARSLPPGWQDERVQNFERTVAGLECEEDMVADRFSAVGRLFNGSVAWAQRELKRTLSPEEIGFMSETLDNQMMERIRKRVDEVVKDPATAEALKPWHRRMCKRPLFSDDYLPTFNRPNVTLVDTKGRGIERLTEEGPVVDGQEYEVDCLIFATGYETGQGFDRRAGFSVTGRNGLDLNDYWHAGMLSFQGSFVRDFPNCLFVFWGNTPLSFAHTFVLNEQGKHLAYVVSEALKRGAKVVEPTLEAVEAHVAEVRAASSSQVAFWKECTPSYFNSEGNPEEAQNLFQNVHPDAAPIFFEKLEKWRQEGHMEGLELS